MYFFLIDVLCLYSLKVHKQKFDYDVVYCMYTVNAIIEANLYALFKKRFEHTIP